MKKIWIRLVSLLIVTLFVLTGVVAAQDVNAAEVVFSATEKENDIVELDVIVKNATFMGLQTALRYNKDVLVPMNEEGEAAIKFSDFAKRTDEAAFFSSVGLELDTVGGFFGFTLYIMPGTESDAVNENDECVAGADGITLYKLRFKKIEEGDYGFAIVTRAETDFVAAVDPGIYIMDYAVGQLTANISFIYEDKEPQRITIVPSVVEKPQQPEMISFERKKDVICLQIGKNQTIAYGKKKLIDPDNELVVPYIVNDRTLVPLRFVAETLGAEVLWEEGWNGCIVKNGDTEIEITFGSAEFKVNGETVTYEAPIEVVHDRTMVPIRFISEALGKDVYWNEKNSAVVISPSDNPWVEGREAENTALGEMLITIMGMFF